MRKLYCYAQYEFNRLMESLNCNDAPPMGVSTISITSKLDEDPNHYFNNSDNNINLDFNDVSPESWWNLDYYDVTFSMWNKHQDFSNFFQYNHENINIHAIDWNEAESLVRFIDKVVKNNNDIYVHCSAGASRSQGVVRYILDTYYDVDWETRDLSPCITPNWHVVRMLKRVYNHLLYNHLL